MADARKVFETLLKRFPPLRRAEQGGLEAALCGEQVIMALHDGQLCLWLIEPWREQMLKKLPGARAISVPGQAAGAVTVEGEFLHPDSLQASIALSIGSDPVERKTPAPKIKDWGKVEGEILRFARAALKKLAARRPRTTFGRFAFDCSAEHPTIALSLDASPASSPDWTPGSFTHSAFAELDDQQKWAPLRDAIEAQCERECDQETPPTARRFLEAACRALISLERDATWRGLTRSDDFQALVLDHDEPLATARRRLAAVRRKIERG